MRKLCKISVAVMLMASFARSGFADDSDRVIKQIEKAGGSVSIETLNGEKLLRVDINAGTKINDAGLHILADLPGVCILDL